jgi:hypothetical protein
MQGCDRQSEETDCLEDLGTDGQVWTVFIWLRIGTGTGPFWIR